jgi:death-on-curing protein
MTRYLSIVELLKLNRGLMESAGTTENIKKLSMIEASLARPKARWGARDLYPTLPRKGAELCCGLIKNPGFASGNIRTAHAALEVMLVLNGYEIAAPPDEQERIMLAVAGGGMNEEELTEWVDSRLARHVETGRT